MILIVGINRLALTIMAADTDAIASMAADTDAIPSMVQPIHTKGTGAGGSRTNSNGLPYEALTELSTEYEIKSTHKYHSVIQFYTQSGWKILIYTKQGEIS